MIQHNNEHAIRQRSLTHAMVLDESILEKAIEHRTLKESTYELIRKLLLRGDIAVGEIYSANALAKELNISNSPVREAMTSLVERGLMETVRNRGFKVLQLTDADIEEIFQLRELVETEAARVVARKHLNESQKLRLRELAAHTDELCADADAAHLFEYLEADQQFHLYLVSLTGNSRWVDLVERLRDQSRANGLYARFISSGQEFKSSVSHASLVDAILTHEEQEAGELMKSHLAYATVMRR